MDRERRAPRGLADRLPTPIEWLSDNGSPYTAHATRALARELGLVPCTTPIESPQSNGIAFVKTFKRDYARVPPCPDAVTVLRQLAVWYKHYNTVGTTRWATGRHVSSESRSWATRPTKRSALGLDRMAAQCPRRRSGQGQPRAARRRVASGLTRRSRGPPIKNHSLSGYLGATTGCIHRRRAPSDTW